MEALAPEHQFLLDLKTGLESGKSAQQVSQKYIKEHSNSFAFELSSWLYHVNQGTAKNLYIYKSFYRRLIFDLINSSRSGEPIYERVVETEKEIHILCEIQIKKFMNRLGFLGLLPLMLFMFPAFLILLFGPIISDLIQQMGG